MNNAQRKLVLTLSRDWKTILPQLSAPAWLRAIAGLLVAIVGRGWAYRITFMADDRVLRIAAHHVLADLRTFCCATADGRRPIFSSDPLVMARRLGRREAFDRIIKYLNLDEAQVQKIMEIDDGI